MAVIVDQKRLGGGSHSTLGTITDISTALRLLFSRIGQPHIGNYKLFSFNDPQGMCPDCNGLGRMLGLDLDKALDRTKSLNEGAMLLPDYAVGSWDWSFFIGSGFFDNDKKLADYTTEEMDRLLYTKDVKIKSELNGKAINLTFEGLVEKFNRKYVKRDVKTMSERTQKAIAPYMSEGPCLLCKGARLSQAALGVKINGRNIAELSALQVDELIAFICAINEPSAAPLLKTLTERLQYLSEIGLDYVSLNRETATLSAVNRSVSRWSNI